MLALIAVMATLSFVVGGVVAVVTSGEASAINASKASLVAAHGVADDLKDEINREQAALDDYVFSRSVVIHTRFTKAWTRRRPLPFGSPV